METFAALESPSMVELPPQELTFDRFSIVSTIRRTAQHTASDNMCQHPQAEGSPGKEIPASFNRRQFRCGNEAWPRETAW